MVSLVAEPLGLNIVGRIGKIRIPFSFDGGKIVEILAHHSCHQLHSGKILNGIFPYKLSVPEYRDPVAYSVDLLQEMGNKD